MPALLIAIAVVALGGIMTVLFLDRSPGRRKLSTLWPPNAYASDRDLQLVHRYWNATNYICAAQVFLRDNLHLARPLHNQDIRFNHAEGWSVTLAVNLLQAHLNRLITARNLNAILVCGPGPGTQALAVNAYLEGTLSELDPSLGQNSDGLAELFRLFNSPDDRYHHGGPSAPGSIHQPDELGQALPHACGAALDNPGLWVFCLFGESEAERMPLAGWHFGRILDPQRDGIVLPILHLDPDRSIPAGLASMSQAELGSMLVGCGLHPLFVSGSTHDELHGALANALDRATERVARLQADSRHLRWPLVVLRTPADWSGIDRVRLALPMPTQRVPVLEEWLRTFHPEQQFGAEGRLRPELAELVPAGARRMSANPHANGGLLLQELAMPQLQDQAVPVVEPGQQTTIPGRAVGSYLDAVIEDNPGRLRIMSTSEGSFTPAGSIQGIIFINHQGIINRSLDAAPDSGESPASPDGLLLTSSDRLCQGWLEGYLLTGRHGLICDQEPLADSIGVMLGQHEHWRRGAARTSWRRPIASLNYLLASHLWRPSPDSSAHLEASGIDQVIGRELDLTRVLLPPDTNCLLAVIDSCLRDTGRINLIVAGKHPTPSYLTMEQAIAHCERGLGIWDWIGSPDQPQIVLAAAGATPTAEAVAAAEILGRHLPSLRVRVVNVVDLSRLRVKSGGAGLTEAELEAVFTRDQPLVFAYHGHPWSIQWLLRWRTGAELAVRGYARKTGPTPFSTMVENGIDRFRLVLDVLNRMPELGEPAKALRERAHQERFRALQHAIEHGEDLPGIWEQAWPEPVAGPHPPDEEDLPPTASA